MNIVVVGAGHIGQHLISYLAQKAHRLTVIDKRKSKCKFISDNYDATIFNDDGGKKEVLSSAVLSQVDIVFALTDDDGANLKVVKLAKGHFGVPKVISIANSASKMRIMQEAGADTVICPAEKVLGQLEELTEGGQVAAFTRSFYSMAEVIIPAQGIVVGKSIQELKLDSNVRIGLLKRGGELIFPDGDTMLSALDQVVVFGFHNTVEKTVGMLRAAEEV